MPEETRNAVVAQLEPARVYDDGRYLVLDLSPLGARIESDLQSE